MQTSMRQGHIQKTENPDTLAATHSPPGSEFRKHWGLWTARSCLTMRRESSRNTGKGIAAICVHFDQMIHWLLGLVA